jgi:hypothetical protein
MRLILAKLVFAFDFEFNDLEQNIDNWEGHSTKAFRTPLMLKASKAISPA